MFADTACVTNVRIIIIIIIINSNGSDASRVISSRMQKCSLMNMEATAVMLPNDSFDFPV